MRGRLLVKPPGAELNEYLGPLAKADKARNAPKKGSAFE